MGTGDVVFRLFNSVNLSSRVSALFTFVGSEEVGTADSALDRCLVENQCIFNVVSFVGDDSDTEVLSLRALVRTD